MTASQTQAASASPPKRKYRPWMGVVTASVLALAAIGTAGYLTFPTYSMPLAIYGLDQVIKAEPDKHLPYAIRGELRRKQGDYDRAIADYGEAIRLVSVEERDAFEGYLVRRATIFKEKGDYPRAIADFSQVIRLRCWDRAVSGKLDDALPYCNEGLRLYVQWGGLDRAITFYSPALALDAKQADYTRRGITPQMLQGSADIYRFIAATSLGKETPENRDNVREGKDVVRLLAQERGRSYGGGI